MESDTDDRTPGKQQAEKSLDSLPVVPITYIQKLLPDLSPLHRWMHGQMKNWVRNFVNKIGESKEMRQILERKLKDGWINPEIEMLWKWLGELAAQEEPLWKALNDQTVDGKQINRNQRFWENFRTVLCCSLDEDSYYVLRYLYLLELIQRDNAELNSQLNVHKRKIYWKWDVVKAVILNEAEKELLKKQGWVIHGEASEKKTSKEIDKNEEKTAAKG